MSLNDPILYLDGGLATELERAHGKDLSGRLWSAHCLDQDPDAIKAVHLSYFKAGANVATTASYQASIRGFLEAGYQREEAVQLMRTSVRLACEARDEYGKGLVALSMGCYGAILANGAEYTGDYGDTITVDDLVDFHQERLAICLQEPGIDFILFETIPSYLEAQAIRKLIHSNTMNLPPVGISFSCNSDNTISDGTLLQHCLEEFHSMSQVFAIGVNCTKPRFIPGLLQVLKEKEQEKTILLYPDGGEEWDAVARNWKQDTQIPIDTFGSCMAKWASKQLDGTRIMLGGCCGTGPAHIASVKKHVVASSFK